MKVSSQRYTSNIDRSTHIQVVTPSSWLGCFIAIRVDPYMYQIFGQILSAQIGINWNPQFRDVWSGLDTSRALVSDFSILRRNLRDL